MTRRVVLGTPDRTLRGEVGVLAAETPGIELVATATDAAALAAALDRHQPDVALLHEAIGPLPVIDLARDLAASHPHVGQVLVVRDRSPEVLRAALQAGVRDVLARPLSLDELQLGVHGAAEWAAAVRERLGPEGGRAARAGGLLVAVVGAKGGVGTTTIAAQLALTAARAHRDRLACLADFDLQAGDVRHLLELPHRRSVADLVAIADDLSARQVEETLYVHRSGLRVLLGPQEGERAEDVTQAAARAVLSTLRGQYALTVVDCGTTVTEAGAVAVELADVTLVVVTPDVLAVRAANRLLQLLERLQARSEGSLVVVNRAARASEVQPDLVRRTVGAPVARTTLPAAFRDLEPAVNTGVPDRLADGAFRRAVGELAEEIAVVDPRAAERPRLRLRAQSGQAAVDLVGMAFTVAVVALVLWQVVLIGATFVFAGHAAREAGATLALGATTAAVRDRARGELPQGWRASAVVTRNRPRDPQGAWVEVRVRVPAFVPGLDTPLRVGVRQGTVVEGRPLPAVVR